MVGRGRGKEAMAVIMVVVLAVIAIVMVTKTFLAAGATPGDTELMRRLHALEKREGFLDRMEARIHEQGGHIKLEEELTIGSTAGAVGCSALSRCAGAAPARGASVGLGLCGDSSLPMPPPS